MWGSHAAGIALALSLLALPRPASAVVGHYAGGFANARDFFLPPVPGLYFAQYSYFYVDGRFRNRNGDPVNTIILPRRQIPIDVSVNVYSLSPMILWSPDWTILGAHYGAFIAPSFGNPSLNAAIGDVENGRGRDLSAGGSWGLGDLYVQPIWLQWGIPHADLEASWGFYAPTGRFEVNAPDNVGLGFWTNQFQIGTAVHADEAKTLSFILVQSWEINSSIQGQDLRPGPRLNLNWAISKIWFGEYLETAVLGYDQWQIGFDSGSDVPKRLGNVEDVVHAAGAQIGVPKLGVAVKYFHEFEARQRFQGNVVTLSFGLPLDPLVDKVAALFE